MVLNYIVFPRVEYNLPIFSADIVTLPRGYLAIIDAYHVVETEEYSNKYMRRYLDVLAKFEKELPWGGALTAETTNFLSPAVIWTRPEDEEVMKTALFSAFKEYFDIFMDAVEHAQRVTDPDEVSRLQDGQNKYVCWRDVKDPGRPVISKLFGSAFCEEYISNFLFRCEEGQGRKTFLEYFPQYATASGEVASRRSMIGKAYPTRPWDRHGRWIG
ncbi:hypothetical protein CBR_g29537 [Chara braunii]|uniref:Uncharacterized protein n=1 Tax=Chara braunii TaxID=69332 RepID=A0A388LAP8_CHABU|nr:hypothetical protein CBR_g29537 [Chara braunii]|eukprot:GBG79388.1 hypothetical protein CBR_g29537 [Chara braunii]